MGFETDTEFTLSDGRKFTNDALVKLYRDNLRSGRIPVAGYFCLLCYNEVSFDTEHVCTHCDIDAKEEHDMVMTETGQQKLNEDEHIKIYFAKSRNFVMIDGTGKVILFQEEDEKGREKGRRYELVPGNAV